MRPERLGRGYVQVYTGDGKGKTTAAMGLALRAAGHGLKVSIYQFLKGGAEPGEVEGARMLSPHVEIFRSGRAAFVASQAGLLGLTRQAAYELAGDHIRLNAVQLERLPGEPSEADLVPVVEQVLFLCSQAAHALTGQVIPVSAGQRL